MRKKELRRVVKEVTAKDLDLLLDLYRMTAQEDREAIVIKEQKQRLGKIDGQLTLTAG